MRARDIAVKRIDAASANWFIRRYHYSGKIVNNSQAHFGCFLGKQFCGALSFGPPLDKRRMAGLVAGSKWNEFLELNRMALAESLPKNSESRCIAIALRMLKKLIPSLKWVVSFANATQCGDGTIYRASGFLLVGIRENRQIIELPNGERVTMFVLTNTRDSLRKKVAARMGINLNGAASVAPFLNGGAKYLLGYQLKYVRFFNAADSKNLTVPIIPFSKLDEIGARMYKGKRPSSICSDALPDQGREGGADPTDGLHTE